MAVSAVRLKLLLGASLLTAAAVSVSGVIGFVGLVVPHLVRVLAGPSHGRLLSLSPATGALILIWADVLARTLLSSGQAAGGRGQRPAGRAVFLLCAQIPPFPGDVVIRVEGLELGYEDRLVLAGLNFQVGRGEFIGILGPNGSDKSTLLNALSGLLLPRKGRISVKSPAWSAPVHR